MADSTGIDTRLESKLGFDRVRKMIADRCSTSYAVNRVESEVFSLEVERSVDGGEETGSETLYSLAELYEWYRMAEEFFPEYPGIAVNQAIAKSKLPDSL